MNILTNREFQVEGNWNAPKAYLLEFKSVIDVELTQTSSSAGDWEGLIFQRLNKNIYAIPFHQQNNWPGGVGFTIYTNENPVYQIRGNELTTEIKEQILEEYYMVY